MARDRDADQVAGALRVSVGLLVRRLRQTQAGDELPLPQSSTLARLERDGPTTASALARVEQISQQSIGATLAALEARGFVERRPHPEDGRQSLVSATESGRRTVRGRREAHIDRMARALDADFTREELARLAAAAPLIERLAQHI
jgi:DNA-binding MarR family transcriptional regulator